MDQIKKNFENSTNDMVEDQMKRGIPDQTKIYWILVKLTQNVEKLTEILKNGQRKH